MLVTYKQSVILGMYSMFECQKFPFTEAVGFVCYKSLGDNSQLKNEEL